MLYVHLKKGNIPWRCWSFRLILEKTFSVLLKCCCSQKLGIQNWANTCMGHKSPDLNVLAPYMIQFEFLMSPFVCLIFLESQTGRAYWYCLWYCASVRLGTFWLLIYDHMRQGTTAMVAFFQVGRSIRLNCHG